MIAVYMVLQGNKLFVVHSHVQQKTADAVLNLRSSTYAHEEHGAIQGKELIIFIMSPCLSESCFSTSCLQRDNTRRELAFHGEQPA